MRLRSVWPALAIAAFSGAVFAALTVAVTTSAHLGLDARAFHVARDLRAPWLDSVVRVITTFGLFAIVGPAVLIATVPLVGDRHRARAAALVAGAVLAWASVWIAKIAVGRPRPPAPLVRSSGESFPSGHAANSVAWTALAIALTIVIRTRGGRWTAVAAGALLTVLVGLTRIYLRVHYASDVLAGEALAVTCYALATAVALGWTERRRGAVGSVTGAPGPVSASPPGPP
jgi:membrane-associated phospholipid phosphatase